MQKIRSVLVTALVVAALSTSIAVAPTASASGGRIPTDGRTSETAAASCWDIKQRFPTSTNGAYWLVTRDLHTPQRFWCDMTTDGGGWVLVGRGREGWTFRGEGQGRASDLADNPDGTDAFSPTALDLETVDGLLNGALVDELPDGVRLRRARNSAGTLWQEMRIDFRELDHWTWAWQFPLFFDTIRIGEFGYRGGSTADTAWQWASPHKNDLLGVNDERRLAMRLSSEFGWVSGYSMGGTIIGSESPTDHLYDFGSDGYPQPFTQIYLRPELTDADIGAAPIPAGGTAPSQVRDVLDDRPFASPWGVRGFEAGNQADFFGRPHEVQVWGLAEANDTIYVGGSFTQVVRRGGSSPVNQRFLAAFDRDTGAWKSAFRPSIAGPVYDVAALPDGRIAVAGDFPDGVVVVDGATGARDTGWRTRILPPSGTSLIARTLDVAGNRLYIGGRFNSIRQPGRPDVAVYNVARVSVVDGAIDPNWRPGANGRVEDLDAVTADGRVYLAGLFNAVNTSPDTRAVAVVNMTDGATVPVKQYELTDGDYNYQQAILRGADGRVYVGGAEHNLHQYSPDLSLLRSHNARRGGDIQSIAQVGNVIYMGCHCEDVLLWDTNQFLNSQVHTRADRINFVVALDADTFEPIAEFFPKFRSGPFHEGPWTMLADSTGCLWIGGDFEVGGWNGAGYDWLGGFARFCERDRTPPPTPTNVRVAVDAAGARVSWTGVDDPSAAYVKYEVLHDDRVVKTLFGWDWSWTANSHSAEASTWAVRAIDPEGNVGPSSAPITYVPAPTVTPFVSLGATMQYLDDGSTPDSCWLTGCALDWPTAPGPIGWGMPGIVSTVSGDPLVHYGVVDFEVDPGHLAGAESVRIKVQRDDGVVLYLNGEEILRDNVAAGPVDGSTKATDYVFGSGHTRFQVVELPAGVLQLGTNRISASIHQFYRPNPDGRLGIAVDLVSCPGGGSGRDTCFR